MNRSEFNVNAAIPKITRARICSHNISRPFPFRRIPLIALVEWVNGFNKVIPWIILGILWIGENIPERSTAGMIKNIAVMIACCWLFEIVEMRRLKLRDVRMNMKKVKKSRKRSRF